MGCFQNIGKFSFDFLQKKDCCFIIGITPCRFFPNPRRNGKIKIWIILKKIDSFLSLRISIPAQFFIFFEHSVPDGYLRIRIGVLQKVLLNRER